MSLKEEIERNIIGHEYEDMTDHGIEIVNDVKRKINKGLSSGQLSESDANYLLGELNERILVGRERIKKTIEKIDNKILEFTKEEAIKFAKQRYKGKSSIWKFFNRKLNPDNLNFKNMEVEEIDNLYKRK